MSRVELYQRAMELKRELDGWCSDEKSHALVDAVLDVQQNFYTSTGITSNRPPVIVEIGVFGGQSLVAFAAAAAATKGHVWGIDPWNAGDSTAHADDPDNTAWWSKVDYEGLYRRCLKSLLDAELTHMTSLLRMSSRQAARLFDDESIDVLHIDGNHAPVSSTFDTVMWVPKVRRGGLIIFDDIDWKQTEMAYELAKQQCDLLKEVGEQGTRFALLQRPTLSKGE